MEYKFVNEFKNNLGMIETVIYSAALFFIPMLLTRQYLVGTVVNSILIISAINIKGFKLLPIIIMPSLGALTNGILFGPFTIFLVYMIPFIWIGNAILVYSFKYFKLSKKINYWLTLLIGSILKAGFLFLIAYVLYSFNLIPVIFLTAMGIIQLLTAVSGGIVAYFASNLTNRIKVKIA